MIPSSLFQRASSPKRPATAQSPALALPEDSRPSATVLVHEDDPITQKAIVKRFEKHASKQGLSLKVLTTDSFEGSVDTLKKPVDDGGEKIDGLFTDNQTKDGEGGVRENAGLELLAWANARGNARYAPFLRVMNSSDPVEDKATQGWLAQKFHSKKEQKTLDSLISNMVKNLKNLKRQGEPSVADDISIRSSRPSTLSRTTTGLTERSRASSRIFEENTQPSFSQSPTYLSPNDSPEQSLILMARRRASVTQPSDDQ